MRTSIYTILTVALSTVFLLASCEKEIKYIGEYDGEKIVLNGILNPEDHEIRVKLSRSQFVFVKDPSKVNDPMLQGAEVVVDVNGTIIRLEEDKDPEHLGEYFCLYQLKEGDKVSIRAHYDGMKDISSQTVVPLAPKAEIKSVVLTTPEERDYRKDIDIKMVLHDDPREENFYQMYCQMEYDKDITIGMESASDDPIFAQSPDFFEMIGDWIDDPSHNKWHSLDGPFDDGQFEGESHEFNIRTGISVWDVPYEYDDLVYEDYEEFYEELISNWNPDPSVFVVNVVALSEDFYKYSRSYSLYMNTDGGVFAEPVTIHSNVKNGIGIFAAVSRKQLRLSKK